MKFLDLTLTVPLCVKTALIALWCNLKYVSSPFLMPFICSWVLIHIGDMNPNYQKIHQSQLCIQQDRGFLVIHPNNLMPNIEVVG